MDSILNSIKKMLNITAECKDFDTDITIHINTVFANLNQLGVGPEEGFSIDDASYEWDDYIPNSPNLNDVKTYTYLKVKNMFDPTSSSVVMEAQKQIIKELEWRLNVTAENQ